MTTIFDPDAGVLRVRHAALAVLARLATHPTDTRLHDHDVAPLVAELRGAGLLGASGIHPDVAPVAAAIGSPHTAGEVLARDHGTVHRMKVWVATDLVVVGVDVEGAPHTYDLMADRAEAAASLIGELVGLTVAPEPPVDGTRALQVAKFEALLDADMGVTAGQVAAAVGTDETDAWVTAFTHGLRGSALRWQLIANRAGVPLAALDVLDAGRSGLWLAVREGDAVTVRAVSPADVFRHLSRLHGGDEPPHPEDA